MKTVTVTFRGPSEADPFSCSDGEFAASTPFFPDDKKDDDSGKPGDSGDADDSTPSLHPGERVAQLPQDATLLTLHRPQGEDRARFNLIMLHGDGALVAVTSDVSLLAGAEPSLLAENFAKPDRVVTFGPYLVFLRKGESPVYSRWLGEARYTEPAPLPAAPAPAVNATPAHLPGFTRMAGDHPEFTVRVEYPAGADAAVAAWAGGDDIPAGHQDTLADVAKAVEEAIARQWQRLVGCAADAGLNLFPAYAVTALAVRPDGDATPDSEMLFAAVSEPSLLNDDDAAVTFRIGSMSASGGVLRLTLGVSRRPMDLTPEEPDPQLHPIPTSLQPAAGERFTIRWHTVVSAPISDVADKDDELTLSGPATFSPGSGTRTRGWQLAVVSGQTRSERLSADAFLTAHPALRPKALASANAATAFNSRLLLAEGSEMTASVPGLPFVAASRSCLDCPDILDLTPSFRALSSGQFGQFPLYLVCSDGVRAASPDGDGFRSVQLISRDRPSALPVALTADSMLMTTPRGLVEFRSATATLLTALTANSSLLIPHYHYAGEMAVMHASGTAPLLFSLREKKLREAEFQADAFCSLWPDIYMLSGRGVYRVESRERRVERLAADGGVESGEPLLYTRPLKLGDPYCRKRVERVRLAPGFDGEGKPMGVACCLEGSNDLLLWHPLARTAGKAAGAQLRPQGPTPWRYFRLGFRPAPSLVRFPALCQFVIGNFNI